MSAQQLPPLCQGATDFESDSDHIGTPIDPPSNCQPYVAGFEPLGDYYYCSEGYGGPEYAAGHDGPHYGHNDGSSYVETSAQHGLLLQSAYTITIPENCNQSTDSTIAAYHNITPSHLPTNMSGSSRNSYVPRSSSEASGDLPGSSFTHSRGMNDSPNTQYPVSSLPYPEYDGDEVDCGEKVGYTALCTKNKLYQLDVSCSTAVPYPLPDMHASYAGVEPSAYVNNVAYGSRAYYDECYADSPIDDPAYHDRLPDQGAPYEQPGYEHYLQNPQPHPDPHFGSGSVQSRPNVRFYQPPSCPYSYPCIDPPSDGSSYGSSPVSPSSTGYAYPVIHAPRPQQVHDIHTLHNSTCRPEDGPPTRMASHHVLSIPSIPAPPSITRPSSLIEDSPKKPLTLACFFCRKRKIACQSPPSSAPDRTCNQCAKRKLKCVYPATSRRGIRPRVYDLAVDDTFRRRPSVSLSH